MSSYKCVDVQTTQNGYSPPAYEIGPLSSPAKRLSDPLLPAHWYTSHSTKVKEFEMGYFLQKITQLVWIFLILISTLNN